MCLTQKYLLLESECSQKGKWMGGSLQNVVETKQGRIRLIYHMYQINNQGDINLSTNILLCSI